VNKIYMCLGVMPKGMKALITLWTISLTGAFDQFQDGVLSGLFSLPKTPKWAVAHDVVLSPGVAFTDQSTNRMYIYGSKLRKSPMTFRNVAGHEYGHLLGMQHDSTFTPNSIMSYFVTEFPNGTVQNDAYEWPLPLSFYIGINASILPVG